MKCFFFGCWNRPGHFLFEPGAADYTFSDRGVSTCADDVHLDGTLAPRRLRFDKSLCWQGQGKTPDERSRIGSNSDECPQGQFLLHRLDNGFTAIQWWDRCQGDTRGGCNSTVLLEGEHTAEEMIGALRAYFPHVLANLEKAGVTLVDVTPAVRAGETGAAK